MGRLVTEADLEPLPPPVRSCLRRAGVVGSGVPDRVVLRQTGKIRSSAEQRWMRFTAVETYEVRQPGFQWRARLRFAGLPLGRVTDSLTDGRGQMQVRLLGLFDAVNLSGPELDQGSLVRWLNETMWFPAVWATDLITWEPVDATSAVGSVAVGDLLVQAEFRFDDDGRFVDLRADRYRQEGDGFVLEPWTTPIVEYSRFGDLELPSAGSGVWHLDDGELEYVRVRVTDLEYDPDWS